MLIGVDLVEIGESFEDNVLFWDSINVVSYIKVGDLKLLEFELFKIYVVCIVVDFEF